MEQIKTKEQKICGFSLVELIVVITIIGVVTALVTVNFASTAKRGRDSRRMADLEKMRLALEMYKQVNGTYPANPGLLVPNFLQQEPKDPKAPTYTYDYSQTSGYNFNLRARMEDLGMTNVAAVSGCGGNCNYQVTNP